MAVKDLIKAMSLGQPDSGDMENMETDAQQKAELLADCQAKYTNIKAGRIPFERQWYLNLAFYYGKHYVTWTTSGNNQRLWEPNTPSYRVKLVSNKCKTVVRTEVAKMLKEKPRGYVVPNTADDKDKVAAKAGGKLYDALETPGAIGMPLSKRTAYFWTSVLGNGFTKQYYDPNKIDFTGAKGSLVIEALSPFSLFVPDLLETEIENQPYVIHVASKPVQWI